MRGVLQVVGALAVAWVLLVLAAWGLQRHLIYLPDRSTPSAPDDVEEVTLETSDGLTLTAWYLTPAGDRVATILVAPGNAGNRALRLPLARGLVDRGHAVLLVDYRGFGGNPGRPDEAGLIRDVQAARAHLADRPDVDASRIVYLGESLGTAVVSALAAKHAPAGLVLRSPFPSLAEVGATHYRFLPVRTLLRDRFETTLHLARYDGPTLVVAGDADRIVPTSLSLAVARMADAEVVVLRGVDHNDRALLDGDAYLDAVDGFVREVAVP